MLWCWSSLDRPLCHLFLKICVAYCEWVSIFCCCWLLGDHVTSEGKKSALLQNYQWERLVLRIRKDCRKIISTRLHCSSELWASWPFNWKGGRQTCSSKQLLHASLERIGKTLRNNYQKVLWIMEISNATSNSQKTCSSLSEKSRSSNEDTESLTWADTKDEDLPIWAISWEGGLGHRTLVGVGEEVETFTTFTCFPRLPQELQLLKTLTGKLVMVSTGMAGIGEEWELKVP